MSEAKKLVKCTACSDYFEWDDEIILANEQVFHKECVTLYPTGYVAFLDEDCIGETENEDGTTAYTVLQEGQYLEEE